MAWEELVAQEMDTRTLKLSVSFSRRTFRSINKAYIIVVITYRICKPDMVPREDGICP